MKTEKLNRSIAAALTALALALAPAPAVAQQVSCTSALSEIDAYGVSNDISSIDTDNPGYRGCCLAIRLAVASREAVSICEAEGVNNAEVQQLRSSLAGLPSSLPLSSCNSQPGGSSSCSEYPAVSFAPSTSPPPPTPGPTFPSTPDLSNLTVPDFNYDSSDEWYTNEWVFAGILAVGVVGTMIVNGPEGGGAFESSAFTVHPVLSFQNDDGESLSRYGARIEYRRPDSPFSLRWSAEGLRGGGSDSMSALFGGEWRGEVWTLGGEAAQRDSDIAFALRVGTAFERAGWTLRLDAESAAWRNGAHGFASDAELLVGMERAF